MGAQQETVTWKIPDEMPVRRQHLVYKFIRKYPEPSRALCAKKRQLWANLRDYGETTDSLNALGYESAYRATETFDPTVRGERSGKPLQFESWALMRYFMDAYNLRKKYAWRCGKAAGACSGDAPARGYQFDETDGHQLSLWGMLSADARYDDREDHGEYDRLDAVREVVGRLLAVCDSRERAVLEARFGIGTGTGTGLTLDEVGALHGICKERVRQLQTSGLDRIRRCLGRDFGEERTARIVEDLLYVGNARMDDSTIHLGRPTFCGRCRRRLLKSGGCRWCGAEYKDRYKPRARRMYKTRKQKKLEGVGV